ncbi:hypothetical protein ABZ135_20155 [Streptomyces sp. NPDC006339]|uniref:hypothetical protein n=1 Tax=Streptomyces sp. NPDC006339 TaxID=3156755 RepID=UPI0033BF82E4
MAIALVALVLSACGSGDGASVDKANDQLRSTSFHSSGTTTAFSGGTQEAWWDPDRGYRLKASWIGGSGEMFCKDGKTYTSAALLAHSLQEKGQSVTVPDRLAGAFVTSETDGGCERFFEIPEAAEHTPEDDRTSQGKQTQAFAVAAGAARDTYYIESDTSRLVELVSARNGRFSTTRYDSFGDRFSISPPSDADTMSMDDFRRHVG